MGPGMARRRQLVTAPLRSPLKKRLAFGGFTAGRGRVSGWANYIPEVLPLPVVKQTQAGPFSTDT